MQLGNIVYSNANALGFAPGSGAAVNGLSINSAGKIVLGQDVAQVGNPAILLNNREIPLGGFGILMSGQTVANPALTFQHAPGSDKIVQPQILFLDGATSAEIGRINMFERNTVLIGRGTGKSFTTAVNNTFLGAFVGSEIQTGSGNIAIGVGTLDFSPGNNPNACIVMGTDTLDTGGGAATVGDNNIVIGHNSFDRPFIFGATNISIGNGSNNSQGGAVGANNIFIGHGTNVTGTLSNSVAIAFPTGTAPLALSNVFVIGNNTQNFIMGANPIGIADNGNKLQIAGKLNTGGAAPLTLGAGAMDFGKVVTAASVLNATKYLEMSVDGVLVKVCIN